MGVGEGEFERNFSSWLVTHLLTTGGRLSLPPMQMREAEAQGRPLEIGGCELWTLSHLGKPKSGPLSGNTVKHTFWKPVRGTVELRA